MKAYTIMAVTVLAGLMGGCASTMTSEQKAKLDAAEHVLDADRMVQEKIAESTSSIASTLQLIERIERGPVAGPGASGQNGASAVPRAGSSSGSSMASAPNGSPRTAVSTNGSAMQSGSVDGMLDARLRIQWRNGSPEELLRTLAKQMGIPFKVTGERRALPPISVTSENESMSWILSTVAKKVDNTADVVLNNTQQPAVLELRFK
jgi:hypothetical protein